MEDLVIKRNQLFFTGGGNFSASEDIYAFCIQHLRITITLKLIFLKFRLKLNTRLTASARLSITQESRSFTNATVVQTSTLANFIGTLAVAFKGLISETWSTTTPLIWATTGRISVALWSCAPCLHAIIKP
jgi:hypothetical protein